MKKICTSVDIGSDTIKILVGEIVEDKIHVLSSNKIKSKGIRKGLIVDSNLVVNAIKDGMNTINNELGFEIKKAIVNVPEYNIKFMYVTGKINISGKVDTEDINKVIKTSCYNKLDKEYELITVIPLEFIINEDDSFTEPIGQDAETLEIKGIMASVPKKNIYSVISVLSAAGIEVSDITISGLADYYQVRNKKTDNLVGAVINLGHETTNVSIINHGKIMNTENIQLGGINIENDIAYVFGTNIVDARKIKEKFATCHKRFTNLNETYILTNNAGQEVKLNQLEVTEVVMSRMKEILTLSKKQIGLLTKRDIEYIIITGGLTEIKSFKNLVYEILGKDVIIYVMDEIGARDNSYTTCIGMLRYYAEKMNIRGKDCTMISPEDEELLLTPDNKRRKEKAVVTKIFKGFMKTKEENL